MFETLRRHPLLVLNQVARDPLDTLAALQENFHSRIEPANTIDYIADLDWESALHRHLGMSLEPEGDGFWPLWSTVVETLRAQGMAVGPFSFYDWNDGDAGLVRAIWCLIRHLRPVNVVETGVAHGMTSRFILEAFETIGAGRLWSIDLPPLNPLTRQEVGVAVRQTGVPVERWTYIAGLRSPLIFSYELNRTWPTTLGRASFVACHSDQQLVSTSRRVLHRVTTSVFSFQPVQANALKSLT
jgi:hypothetical protein